MLIQLFNFGEMINKNANKVKEIQRFYYFE